MGNSNGHSRFGDQDRNSTSANGGYRKRDASEDHKSTGDRVKKFRWDEGPAPAAQPSQLMGTLRPSSNGSASSYNRSNNGQAYGPYPTGPSNGHGKTDSLPQLPPPPPPSSNGHSHHAAPPPPPSSAPGAPASQSYYPTADYSQMYNLQYYQAIAAAAAANGGGWQAASGYPSMPPNPVKTPK